MISITRRRLESRRARGELSGSVDVAQIAVDAVGNAHGSAYLQQSQPSAHDDSSAEIQRLLRQNSLALDQAPMDVGAATLANVE